MELNSIADDLTKRHILTFRLAVMGISGCGKTTFTLALIDKLKKKCRFDRLVLCGNTIEIQPGYDKLRMNNSMYVLKKIPNFSDLCKFKDAHSDDNFKILLVCDDLDKNQYETDNFGKLVQQGRHLNLSVIIITHCVTYLPPSLRYEFNYAVIMKAYPELLPMRAYKSICKELQNSRILDKEFFANVLAETGTVCMYLPNAYAKLIVDPILFAIEKYDVHLFDVNIFTKRAIFFEHVFREFETLTDDDKKIVSRV